TAQGSGTDALPEKSLAAMMTEFMLLKESKGARSSKRNPGNSSGVLSKNMLGGVVGNALEWYDFAIFGYLAPVMGENFFPSSNPVNSLIGAFSVFASAFIARPLGGILLGYIGDRLGRKQALQLSVMMMAVPTFLVGILPTYATIGIFAPILLFLLRVIQGLSVGGELIGSITFVAENAPPSRQGFFGSWASASCYLGMMMGSLTAILLNSFLGEKALAVWAWRLPFLSGIIIALVALWMRRELTETPVFEEMKAEGHLGANPLGEAVRRFPGSILLALMLSILDGGGFYILFLWWPTYLCNLVHPHIPYVAALSTSSLLLLIILIPFAGELSDRLGRRNLLLWSSAGMMIFSWPLFMFASQGGFMPVFLAQFCFTALMALFLGSIPAALVGLFPPRFRFSAIGIAFNVSMCIFGGTAPLITTWLIKHYNTVSAPALYLVFLAFLTFQAALSLPKSEKTVLHI
ncbi:MAG: MFS transporter, partial [Candidatus Riflebacteria bacterium]|nr:MFS transporter [Candidatus Riflebacteria bacterium]